MSPPEAGDILDYPVPTTKRRLRKFIKNLSEKLKPLYELINSESFKWKEEHTRMFEDIKKLWKENTELEIPDNKIRFCLETDASDIGLGAVLKQNRKPVAYISRLLKGAEKNYSITEKELLAVIWSMEKLEYFLRGVEFDVLTDHKALVEIPNKKLFGSARVQRWYDRLSQFNFKINYIKGTENHQADTLSRNFKESTEGEEINLLATEIEENVLKIHKENTHRKNIEDKLIEKGIELNQNKINKILVKCRECLEYDRKYDKFKGYVQTNRPGERVGLDVMELIKGQKVMIGIDYFTRKVYGLIIKEKKPDNTIKLLEKIKAQIKIE